MLPKIWHFLFRPALAPLIRNRVGGAALAAMVALQVGLTGFDLPGWSCPAGSAGVPCPGCGLSRAIVALLHGDLARMWELHALAPLGLLASGLIGVGALLPEAPRGRLANWVESVERRTGMTTILLGVLIAYWLGRTIVLGHDFAALVAP